MLHIALHLPIESTYLEEVDLLDSRYGVYTKSLKRVLKTLVIYAKRKCTVEWRLGLFHKVGAA